MKNLKIIALTLFAFVISATAINAAPITPFNKLSAEDPFTVKYIGNEGDYLLFEVIVRTDDNKHTFLGISEKAEGEIYSAKIWSAYKVQTMKIEKRDHQELDFKLKIGNVEYARSFAILATVEMKRK